MRKPYATITIELDLEIDKELDVDVNGVIEGIELNLKAQVAEVIDFAKSKIVLGNDQGGVKEGRFLF